MTSAGPGVLLSHDNPRLPAAAVDRIYEVSRSWPTLVVWGTDDVYIPWRQADRQRESFPSASVQLLEGLGDWPFLEDPARVAEHVIPFLREQVRKRSAGRLIAPASLTGRWEC